VRDPNLALEAADTLLVDSTLASAVGNVKGVKPAGTRTDTWPTQAQAQAPARPRLRPRPRSRSRTRSRCCGYAGHCEAVGGARLRHPDGAARLWTAAQRAGCAHARRPPAAGGRWGIADIVGKGETRANDADAGWARSQRIISSHLGQEPVLQLPRSRAHVGRAQRARRTS
jgi:hypothetical protein